MFVNLFDRQAASRLLEFFADGTPWHRALWGTGSALAIKEVMEAADQLGMKPKAYNTLCTHALNTIKGDSGFGSEKHLIQKTLAKFPKSGSNDCISLKMLADVVLPRYLADWSIKARAAPAHLRVESTARLVAAHSLESGFSVRQCHHILLAMARQPNQYVLADYIGREIWCCTLAESMPLRFGQPCGRQLPSLGPGWTASSTPGSSRN